MSLAKFALRNPRTFVAAVKYGTRVAARALRSVPAAFGIVVVQTLAAARAAERAQGILDSTSVAALEHRPGVLIYNVHDPARCTGETCPIHRRTDHPLRAFPQNFRGDRGFMERVCPHGVGHPDPDDPYADPRHGCDGCCAPDAPVVAVSNEVH